MFTAFGDQFDRRVLGDRLLRDLRGWILIFENDRSVILDLI